MSITLSLVKLAFTNIIPENVMNVFGYVLIVLYVAAVAVSIFSLFHYAYKGGFIGKKYREHSPYEERQPRR